MKTLSIGLGILILTCPAWAGTFLETFDEGKLVNWEELIMFGVDVPGSWEVIDGELQGSNGGITRLLTIGQETWEDYDIEFDVKPLEKHGQGSIAVAARLEERWGGSWGVVCELTDSGNPAAKSTAECFAGNLLGNTFLLYGQKPHPLLKLRKWATFKLSVHGKDLTFWINGKQVLDPITLEPLHGFPEFPRGRIGLGLANYTVRFDNLKITGPHIPNSGGLSIIPKAKLATTWGQLKRF